MPNAGWLHTASPENSRIPMSNGNFDTSVVVLNPISILTYIVIVILNDIGVQLLYALVPLLLYALVSC